MIRCLFDGTIWDGRAWVPEQPREARPTSAYVVGDLPAYKSPLGTGVIDGRSARREDLKRNNCREVEPSEHKAVYRNPRFAKKHGLELGGDPLPQHKRMPTVIGPRSLGGQEPG